METAKKRILATLKREPVLTIASVCAVISMFVVPPGKGYMHYIDWKTLLCLFCLMVSIKGLENEGLLDAVSRAALTRIRNVRTLVFFLVFGVFLASMLMTNDVALIVFVPIAISVMYMCKQTQWTAYVVVLQTIAANIGSMLTPIGNPQNLYIYSYYDMEIADFFLTVAPYVLGGGVCLAISCLFVKSDPLEPIEASDKQNPGKHKLAVYTALFILSACSVFGAVHYTAAALIVTAVVFITDRGLLAKIDFSLLITFAVIFIFVGNLSNIPQVEDMLQEQISKDVVLASALSSQLISNVPAAILLSKFTDDFHMLLIGVNIGGLGTLIASMASVISYKLFVNVYQRQSAHYLKIFALYNIVFLPVLLGLHWLLQLPWAR